MVLLKIQNQNKDLRDRTFVIKRQTFSCKK